MRIYFSFLVIAGALIMAGCGSNGVSEQNKNESRQNGWGGRNASSTGGMNFGIPAAVSDLAVGKKVVITGTANADGSISASRIMIGEMPFGPGFGSSTLRFMTGTQMTRDQNQAVAPPGDNPEFRPTESGDFHGSPPSGSGQKRIGRMSGEARINGEIIQLDASSIIIKAADGGSKMVFYSDRTPVFMFPTSTPSTMATSTPLPPLEPPAEQ